MKTLIIIFLVLLIYSCSKLKYPTTKQELMEDWKMYYFGYFDSTGTCVNDTPIFVQEGHLMIIYESMYLDSIKLTLWRLK